MDAERQIMEGNGQGLIEFLDTKGERGDVNRTTAKAFRIATAKILSVESANLASIDIRKLDVPDLLERFANRHRADYGDGSLETYKSRFRRSVAMYLSWLEGDSNWKNAGLTAAGSKQQASRPAHRAGARKQAPKTREPDAAAESRAIDLVDSRAATESITRLMTYHVPLRPDLIVSVSLPVDLTMEDAERLANFVRSLAFSGQVGPESRAEGGG